MEKTINKGMFGLFFEDINYGLDGGLHAEMLENRSFEFVKGLGFKSHYHQEGDYLYGWNVYPSPSYGDLTISTKEPLNEVNPHYLIARAAYDNCGFSNKAYDGIYLSKGQNANISFYAKIPMHSNGTSYDNSTVKICIFDRNRELLCESDSILINSNNWTKYEASVTAKADIAEGIFTVIMERASKVCFDQFRMYPDDAVLGLFRKDLVELLADLKPGFMRFPGGCVVEGNELTNRYQWKKTVGPSEERKSNWNRWAVHENDNDKRDLGKFPDYNQTLGIGFYEYFLLCEYLGCEPLPVMNVGLACQYQSKELVKSDSPEFDEFVQDALDLIEFANGDTNTKWGALRKEMGHEKPFNLKLIGIGNEQWETEEVDFFHRYEVFEKAIHDKYPEIKCCGSAGPDVTSDHYKDAWNHFSPKMKENPSYSYAVDEHYYVSDEWMYNNVHFYDNYDKHKKVFAGEYACHINHGAVPEKRNTLGAAIAEAAFMTGLERNADVVLMASYAPLFARIRYTQWQPDLIWFDGSSAYGTPSYYVQKLYSLYTGTKVVNVDYNKFESEKVYVTASKDDSKLFVKIINADNAEKSICLTDLGISQELIKDKAISITMSGNPDDCNSIAQPKLICPKESDLDNFDGKVKVEAHSVNVFVMA